VWCPATAPSGLLVSASQQIAACEMVGFRAAGHAGVPSSGVGSVGVAVTAQAVSGALAGFGYVALWAAGSPAPPVSSVVWVNGEAPTQMVTVPVGVDGRIDLFSGFGGSYSVKVLGDFATATLGGTTFSYDENGNRLTETDTTTGITTSYGWDDNDRLITVSKVTGSAALINSAVPVPNSTNPGAAAWQGTAPTRIADGMRVNTTAERNAIGGLYDKAYPKGLPIDEYLEQLPGQKLAKVG
jgi:hypothetical protein